MSKKKNAPANPSPVSHPEEPPRRPRALGLILLAAGGFSTWYWYKPLPEESGVIPYSQWNHPGVGMDGHWTNTELIRPSINDGGIESGDFGPSVDSELIAGTSPGSLIPVPPMKRDLGELLASEKLPPLPSLVDPSAPSPNEVKPWTEIHRGVTSVSGPTSATKWPDLAYKPTDPRSLPSNDVAVPALLGAADTRPRIRIQDEEVQRPQESNSPSWGAPASSHPNTNIAPSRPATSFIKQPKR